MSIRDSVTGRFRSLRPAKAKKIYCPRCGQYKLKRDFYKFKSSRRGWIYATYCKECVSELHKQYYQKNKQRKDGVYKIKDGTLRNIKHTGKRTGASCKLFWSQSKIDYLKQNYATTKNAELVSQLGFSLSTVIRKARELGLKKDRDYCHNISMLNCEKMRIINKSCGNSGMFKKGQHACPEHEFKKRTMI